MVPDRRRRKKLSRDDGLFSGADMVMITSRESSIVASDGEERYAKKHKKEDLNDPSSNIISLDSEDENGQIGITHTEVAEVSQRPRKVSEIARLFRKPQTISRSSSLIDNSVTWVEKYCPSESSQLCIHERKISELRTQIQDMVNSRTESRILVLSGPSGCGKSVSAKILCEEVMNSRRRTHSKMVIEGYDHENRLDNVVQYRNWMTQTSSEMSSVTSFGEFLESCKVLTMDNLKCVVVEELPNLHHDDTLKAFRKSILEWLDLDAKIKLPPLILCITEYEVDLENGTGSFSLESNFKTEFVLGSKIIGKEGKQWTRIKFNPVAKRYLKRCLKRIAIAEDTLISSIKQIPRQMVEQKIEKLCGTGDLRNAIILFEYWCKYCSSLTDEFLGRESALNVFHSIGKIIYGTKHPEDEYETYIKRAHEFRFLESLQSDLKPQTDYLTVMNVVTEISQTSLMFHLNLLENYLSIASRLNESIARISDTLSISDDLRCKSYLSYSFSGGSLMNEIATTIACLGTRMECKSIKADSNKSGAFLSMRYSRDSKYKKKLRRILQETADFAARRAARLIPQGRYTYLSAFELVSCDGFYECSILNSKKLLKKSEQSGIRRGMNMRRLGGDFTNLMMADTEFKVDDDEEVDMPVASKIKSQLEELYFGTEAPALADDSDTEFDTDPIVNTDQENMSADEFSDDSLVLQL
ncbi:hypothetical protein KL936_001371 [Ogataea polymorpha]|nr:hypothetical protein KL936_001371 [Ogataea polymorpha]